MSCGVVTKKGISSSLPEKMQASSALHKEYHEEGVVYLPNFLDAGALELLQECFDWSEANPSDAAVRFYEKNGAGGFYQDAGYAVYRTREFFESTPFGPLLEKYGATFATACQDLWGRGPEANVWFFGSELFHKFNGVGRTSPYHQDLSYGAPFGGEEICAFWICLEDFTPAKNSLEVVPKSHRGTFYNAPQALALDGSQDDEGVDDTTPMYTDEDYTRVGLDPRPRMPDIAKEREKWDLRSFDLRKGDVTVFHMNCIHGGAGVDAAHPQRRTLVLRFFGDGCTYRPTRPMSYQNMATAADKKEDPIHADMKEGDSYGFAFGQAWLRVAGPGLPPKPPRATSSIAAKL